VSVNAFKKVCGVFNYVLSIAEFIQLQYTGKCTNAAAVYVQVQLHGKTS
jgi:hypothetical protein